jgi:hypothetical protein
MSKAVHIEGQEYPYEVYRDWVKIRLPNGKRELVNMEDFAGWICYDSDEWTRVVVRPSHIKAYIEKVIIGKQKWNPRDYDFEMSFKDEIGNITAEDRQVYEELVQDASMLYDEAVKTHDISKADGGFLKDRFNNNDYAMLIFLRSRGDKNYLVKIEETSKKKEAAIFEVSDWWLNKFNQVAQGDPRCVVYYDFRDAIDGHVNYYKELEN